MSTSPLTNTSLGYKVILMSVMFVIWYIIQIWAQISSTSCLSMVQPRSVTVGPGSSFGGLSSCANKVELKSYNTLHFAPINSAAKPLPSASSCQLYTERFKTGRDLTGKTRCRLPAALRGNWCKWAALLAWFIIELGPNTWKLLSNCDLTAFNWQAPKWKMVRFSRGDLMCWKWRTFNHCACSMSACH